MNSPHRSEVHARRSDLQVLSRATAGLRLHEGRTHTPHSKESGRRRGAHSAPRGPPARAELELGTFVFGARPARQQSLADAARRGAAGFAPPGAAGVGQFTGSSSGSRTVSIPGKRPPDAVGSAAVPLRRLASSTTRSSCSPFAGCTPSFRGSCAGILPRRRIRFAPRGFVVRRRNRTLDCQPGCNIDRRREGRRRDGLFNDGSGSALERVPRCVPNNLSGVFGARVRHI